MEIQARPVNQQSLEDHEGISARFSMIKHLPEVGRQAFLQLISRTKKMCGPRTSTRRYCDVVQDRRFETRQTTGQSVYYALAPKLKQKFVPKD